MLTMRRTISILFSLAAILTLSAAAPDSSEKLIGFSDQGAKTELSWEAKFKAIPSPDNLRDYDRRLSARPHHVGSAYDKDNAEWILAKFKEWGWDAHIETFDVLFPTPKERSLEMVAPTHSGRLEEPTLAVDPTSGQQTSSCPSYNAYSSDGDVTAPLVYVNYGVPEDYEQLDRLRRLRQGRHRHRALRRHVARHQAEGRGRARRRRLPDLLGSAGGRVCEGESSPRADAPARRRAARQRHGHAGLSGRSADARRGRHRDAKRLPLDEVTTLTKIPVLPISYADAQPLLAALTGPMAPEEWRGALRSPIGSGPGPAKVHLKVAFNWD